MLEQISQKTTPTTVIEEMGFTAGSAMAYRKWVHVEAKRRRRRSKRMFESMGEVRRSF